MSDLVKTNFLGVTIDTENGSTNSKINKALNKSLDLLDIMKFVEVTKFRLNMTMFDYFWQVVIGNRRVHLSSTVLEWFGYEGETKDQKRAFIKMLQRNDIEYCQLIKIDKEIEQYPTIKEELQLMTNEGAKQNSKFILMEPKDLKMAIMQLKTKNGHIIRQYYIDLEELLKLYVEYTLYFNHRKSQKKITGLEQMMAKMDLDREKDRQRLERQEQIMMRQEQYMKSIGISLEEVKDQNETLIDQNVELLDNNKGLKKEVKKVQRKLGIAVEDRAPLPDDESKRERFVLLKRNDDQQRDYYQYYTIRAQDSYTTRRIKIQKIHFPNLVILLDFKCSPNSKTLYTRIRETLSAKGVTFDGNNIDLDEAEINEEELLEEMKVINDAKRDV
jgi:hypothetical protein